MLAAASLVLTQAGEGSSPSGPTSADVRRLVVGLNGRSNRDQRSAPQRSSTGRLAAKTPLSYSGYAGSSPARCSRSLTIQQPTSAHDVAAAYCLAMADVWVRLPLGALEIQDVGKPGIPRASGARDRWFESSRPD